MVIEAVTVQVLTEDTFEGYSYGMHVAWNILSTLVLVSV